LKFRTLVSRSEMALSQWGEDCARSTCDCVFRWGIHLDWWFSLMIS